MWFGALLAVVVLGFPVVLLVGLVHGVRRITRVGLDDGNPPALVDGPASDSRDQVDFGRGDERRNGVTQVPRIGPFVRTCFVLMVALLVIGLALGWIER
jgi:hypothetical protein